MLVAEAAHGDSGGQFAGGVGENGDERLDVGYAFGAAVDPGERLPVHDRVAVGVDESGVDEAAVEVEVEDVVGAAAERGAGVFGGADVDDPAAADGQRLGAYGGAGRGDGRSGHQERAVGVVEGVVHEGPAFDRGTSMRSRTCGESATADSFAWTICSRRCLA